MRLTTKNEVYLLMNAATLSAALDTAIEKGWSILQARKEGSLT